MADAAWPDDALEVGRIGDAWGLKGWFKVQPYATPAEALLAARLWHLQPAEPGPALRRAGAGVPGVLEIREVREHGEGLVAAAGGIDDRNGAEALRGARIFIARASFPEPGADEFYWADLIGLAVVNRGGVVLGTVAGAMLPMLLQYESLNHYLIHLHLRFLILQTHKLSLVLMFLFQLFLML